MRSRVPAPPHTHKTADTSYRARFRRRLRPDNINRVYIYVSITPLIACQKNMEEIKRTKTTAGDVHDDDGAQDGRFNARCFLSSNRLPKTRFFVSLTSRG